MAMSYSLHLKLIWITYVYQSHYTDLKSSPTSNGPQNNTQNSRNFTNPATPKGQIILPVLCPKSHPIISKGSVYCFGIWKMICILYNGVIYCKSELSSMWSWHASLHCIHIRIDQSENPNSVFTVLYLDLYLSLYTKIIIVCFLLLLLSNTIGESYEG